MILENTHSYRNAWHDFQRSFLMAETVLKSTKQSPSFVNLSAENTLINSGVLTQDVMYLYMYRVAPRAASAAMSFTIHSVKRFAVDGCCLTIKLSVFY